MTSQRDAGANGWRVALGLGSAHAGLEPVVVDPEAGVHRLLNDDGRHARLVETAEGGDTTVHELLLGARTTAGPDRRGTLHQEVVIEGWRVEVELEPAVHAALRARAHRGDDETSHGGPTEVRAIIPGVVVSVSVNPGDEVVTGQQMLVVEAMKMQNELKAPRAGRVERVAVGAGKTIELGELLLVIA